MSGQCGIEDSFWLFRGRLAFRLVFLRQAKVFVQLLQFCRSFLQFLGLGELFAEIRLGSFQLFLAGSQRFVKILLFLGEISHYVLNRVY